MAITLTQTFLDTILAGGVQNIVAANYTGMLYAAKVLLFTNQPVLSPQSAYADLTAPTWTGYAEIVATWAGPVIDGVGNLLLTSQVLNFTPSATPSPGVIVYGYGIYSATVPSAGHNLIGAEYFPYAINVTSTLTGCIFVAQIVMPQANIYGGVVML
jgi:hypothetical protein